MKMLLAKIKQMLSRNKPVDPAEVMYRQFLLRHSAVERGHTQFYAGGYDVIPVLPLSDKSGISMHIELDRKEVIFYQVSRFAPGRAWDKQPGRRIVGRLTKQQKKFFLEFEENYKRQREEENLAALEKERRDMANDMLKLVGLSGLDESK